MGRDDVVRLLVEPEEVHSRDEDGFRRLEETARQSRSDRVFERQHQVNEPPRFNKYYSSIKLYTLLQVFLVVLILACFSRELFADRSNRKKQTKTQNSTKTHLFCALNSLQFPDSLLLFLLVFSVSNQFIHTRPDKGNREIQIARTHTEEEVKEEVKEDELGKSSIQSNQFTSKY